jgi:hypothetical protein
MHEYPVFDSTTSVSTQDFVKHKPGQGRSRDLREIEVGPKLFNVLISEI